MSATVATVTAAAIEAGSIVTAIQRVRMMPGPLGLDSPLVPGPELPPLAFWYAWMDLVGDRAAGRPSTAYLLERCMDRRLEELWGLWWLTLHRDVGQWLVHRARVYVHDAGYTLVSACLLSLPWTGPSDAVMPVVEAEPGRHVARCVTCAELTDSARTGPIPASA